MNELGYPNCPECEIEYPMHPYEFEGESGWSCDRCGYSENNV